MIPQREPAARPQVVDQARLKAHIVELIVRELEHNVPPAGQEETIIDEMIKQALTQAWSRITPEQVERLSNEIKAEVVGYGPITSLLNDPEVTEVMVNGPDNVYVEKGGRLIKTDVRFRDDLHVRQVIDRIVLPLGRRIDEDSPTVDARLPDGSRVNAVVSPVGVDGSSITIRKFSQKRLTVQDLIRFGSMTEQISEFLRACVVSRLNIVISGGTGSGKTTLLNVLSGFIPDDERIVTIEDAAELQLSQDNLVRLETKPPNISGEGAVPIRALVRNSLRMRPDRIVVGEVRGGEALDMLQAMNTGHDGSLTTLHANSPRDALSRLETMSLMSGLDLPLKVIREQIASAVDLVVQQSRIRDGSRRVTYVTEVSGMEGNTIVMTDIFKFNQTGMSQEGKVIGSLEPTGLRPMFVSRLQDAGFNLSAEIFMPAKSTFSEDRRRR
ncbi:MAG TPA: CpaF family protein [Anaerolineales bacterium]|nr:CpaF family protein [Anaerolineales bacterium]